MFIIISCRLGSSDTADTSPTASNFKVAIVIPDAIDDRGWSQSGYEGLKLIEKQLKAEVAYTEKTNLIPPDEVANILRGYAKQGFNFIICHGGQYISAAKIVAKEFQRTKFALIGGYGGNNINLGSLSFRDGELGYLAGVVAALKTKTNKVLFMGGVDYSNIKEQATLFARGAKAIKPDISVTIAWLGNWTATDKARKIAEEQIKSGVDVLAVDADPAGLVVHQIAQKRGVYSIGWIQDQYHLAPGSVLTSGVQRISNLMLKGANLVLEGRWEGKQYKFGLREKVQELAAFRETLTSDQQLRVNKIEDEILTGKIDVSP